MAVGVRIMSSGGLATLDLVNQLAQGFSIIATPVRMDCLYHSEEGWNNGKPRVTSFGVRAFRQPSHRRIGNEVGRLKRRNRRAIAKSYTNNVAPDRITCLVVIEELLYRSPSVGSSSKTRPICSRSPYSRVLLMIRCNKC
jgi:hypothetical protein